MKVRETLKTWGFSIFCLVAIATTWAVQTVHASPTGFYQGKAGIAVEAHQYPDEIVNVIKNAE